MAMDLDEVEVRQTIDQTSCGNFANTPEIIFVYFVDVPADKLPGAVGNIVEHLVWIIEVMNRAQNEIEFFPIFLNPRPAGR